MAIIIPYFCLLNCLSPIMSSTEPYVSRLFIYPVKSLDGVEVSNVTILASGAIVGDRTWAIFDESDRFIGTLTILPIKKG